MWVLLSRLSTLGVIAGFVLSPVGGCTTTTLTPAPIPPIYIEVPHPAGMDLADLSAILTDPKAPKSLEFPKTCDSDFQKLLRATQSLGEIEDGTKELVRMDPVHYHWCFYSKIFDLEKQLKEDSFLEDKQKRVLNVFEFLTPIAKAFVSEFHDSRYLRWAVVRYQKSSEWIFFRRLELTPSGTLELVQPSDPFGVWRRSPEKMPILDKYQIVKIPISGPDAFPLPTPVSSPFPAPSPTPYLTPSPVPTPVQTKPEFEDVGLKEGGDDSFEWSKEQDVGFAGP